MTNIHCPVLLDEVLLHLNPVDGKKYIDCTLGFAGHSREILKKIVPNGKLLGIERDNENIEKVEQSLQADFPTSCYKIVNNNFKNIKEVAEQEGFNGADGILFDFGVSSYHLDKSNKGFSFSRNDKLDMRFNENENNVTAEEIINTYSEQELIKILREFGEERYPRRIVFNILKERKLNPITTTTQLVSIIERSVPRKLWPKKIHVATKTFQALRIAVNHELEAIEQGVKGAIDVLGNGGILAVISFHSLEDRIVKNIFKEEVKTCVCPKSFPICVCDKKQRIEIITRRPIIAGEEENLKNKRARSAKLRIIKKLTF